MVAGVDMVDGAAMVVCTDLESLVELPVFVLQKLELLFLMVWVTL